MEGEDDSDDGSAFEADEAQDTEFDSEGSDTDQGSQEEQEEDEDEEEDIPRPKKRKSVSAADEGESESKSKILKTVNSPINSKTSRGKAEFDESGRIVTELVSAPKDQGQYISVE